MIKNSDFSASYDRRADVLYLRVGPAREAISHEDELGLLWRSVRDGQPPFGVTIIDFHDGWSSNRSNLVRLISGKLHVPLDIVEAKIPF